MPPRLAYPVAEAAQLIGVSVRSVRYLLKTGKLGYARLGRRVVIPHRDLERLLRQGYCRPIASLDADEAIRPRNGNAPERATPEALITRAADQAALSTRSDSNDNTPQS
jgi:excisionase family DNA binding protein